MGTKTKPGAFDCYANALPDEPMFVLLGRDPSAPRLIEIWATVRLEEIIRGVRPDTDRVMVREAFACVEAMKQWRIENDGKWRKGSNSK